MSTETRTLIDAAAEHLPVAEIRPISADAPTVVAVITPAGQTVRFEDLEKYGAAPARIRQHPTFETPEGFNLYVNTFRGHNSRIFASLKDRKVVALLDYHGAAPEAGIRGASWITHRATYPATFHPSFAAWARLHNESIPQAVFAEFLQDHAEDAVKPEPADLMEIASKFEAVRNVEFRQAINISTGERQFQYDEKDSVSGALPMPKAILLRTPIFVGCPEVDWGVRLNYTIKDKALYFRVMIHRFEDLLDREFEALVASIAEACDPVPIHRAKID